MAYSTLLSRYLDSDNLWHTYVPPNRYLSKAFQEGEVNFKITNTTIPITLSKSDNVYTITALIPGCDNSDDIKVSVTKGNSNSSLLTIEANILSSINKTSDTQYYNEISPATVKRTIVLNSIDNEKYDASYRNGVLYLTLTTKEKETKTITINREND